MPKGKFKGIKMKPLPTPDPPPYAQLDRIERMLKWVVIKKQLERNHQERLTAGEIQNKEGFEKCVEDWKKLKKQLPDISDIVE